MRALLSLLTISMGTPTIADAPPDGFHPTPAHRFEAALQPIAPDIGAPAWMTFVPPPPPAPPAPYKPLFDLSAKLH